jgi:tetratricopeptide (TPR) repeat protein
MCGDQFKREVFVLVSAVREQVPSELVSSSSGVPKEVVLARLSKRLHGNLGIAEELARWGVESWALALGILQVEEKTFPFKCPSCGASGKMGSSFAGKRVKCPKCRVKVQISDDCMVVRLIDGGHVQKSVTSRAENHPLASHASDSDPFAEELSATTKDMFRQALRRVLADGVITEEGRAEIQHLRRRMGIPHEEARGILAEIKTEISSRGTAVPDPLKTAEEYYEKAEAFHSQGEPDLAIAAATEAIRLDPNHAGAYRTRSLAYLGRQDVDRSLADATEAIRLDPKHAWAYGTRGEAYRRRGDFDPGLTHHFFRAYAPLFPAFLRVCHGN